MYVLVYGSGGMCLLLCVSSSVTVHHQGFDMVFEHFNKARLHVPIVCIFEIRRVRYNTNVRRQTTNVSKTAADTKERIPINDKLGN